MKQNIRYFSGLCAVILLLTYLMTVSASSASLTDVTCSNGDKAYAIYLYNVTEEKGLYEQNIDKSISPASTVKLMTALVAFDCIPDIKKEITITQSMIEGMETNVMKLSVGESISYENLLIGLVCGGYNDAAQALAVATCGSVGAFVAKMNEKAGKLGASNTVYKEPTGIDDSASTTAYDTMLVAREFMKNEILTSFSSLPSYKIPATNKSNERHIYNRNALKSSYSTVNYLNPNAIGMNAGMTSGGGYCVVTGVANGDMKYVCVVMGAKHGSESNITYSYAIANEFIAQIKRFDARPIISLDEEVGTLPIEGASLNKESVSLRPSRELTAYLPQDYETTGLLEYTYVYSVDKVIAPVEEGTVVGKIVVSYDGEQVGVCDIVIAETVERELIIYLLFVIRSFLGSRVFFLIIISFIVLLFIKFVIIDKPKHKKSKYVKRF